MNEEQRESVTLGEPDISAPALREIVMRGAPGTPFDPQFLSTCCVAGITLSAFYTFGPHKDERGMDIIHLL